MRCSTKPSGIATVAVLSVLPAAPGEIAASPASALTSRCKCGKHRRCEVLAGRRITRPIKRRCR